MPIPCRIGKANTSVRAEIGGAESGSYYSCLAYAKQTLRFERKSAAPSIVNIIAVGKRQRDTEPKGYRSAPLLFRALRAPNLDEKLSIWYIFVVRRALRRLLPLSLKGGRKDEKDSERL